MTQSVLRSFCATLAFALFITTALVTAQELTLTDAQASAAAQSALASQVHHSILLAFSAEEIGNILQRRPASITLALPFSLPLPSRIELDAFDIFTPEAKAYVVTPEGSREVPFRQRWITYRGSLPGEAKSQVVLNITPNGIDATIESKAGRYHIRMAERNSTIGTMNALFFSASAWKSVAPFLCGVEESQAPIPDRRPVSPTLQFGPAISTDTIDVRVALEGDYELFLAMGTEQAAMELMMATATFASGVYLIETGVKLTVPFIRVWTTTVNHPYGHTDLFTTSDEFISHWKQNMNDVDRTVAHLFTNSARWSNISGFVGIAQLNALCSNQTGYGVTEVRQPAGDGHLMTFVHELGHNFGARHTHSCFWPGGPIDLCAQIENGGCYKGPIVQSEGTIMSYCATRAFVFGQIVSDLIRRNAEFAACAPSTVQSAVAAADSSFLNELFTATGGSAWEAKDNWGTGSVSRWKGVTVRGGRVIAMNLSANNLTGPIPSTISNLTALKSLNLSGRNKYHVPYVAPPDPATDRFNANRMTGSIPSSIGQLTELEELDVSNNLFTGEPPEEILSMTKLRVINLSENSLASEIPFEIGNLTNLELLDIWRTNVGGPIPSSIGNLTKLQVLVLSNTFGAGISGPIPPELGNLSRLTILDLSMNKLSGSIPSQLGNLSSLTVLHLQNNQLTGSIPAEFASLTGLQSFALSDNQLSGSIPSFIGTFTSLSSVSLQNNQFSGPIPTELGNLGLLGLHLENNRLTGPIPPALGRLTSLLDFALQGNQLTGTIPDSLQYLGSTAPSDFGGLLIFNVADNRLTGAIPSWLQQRTGVTELGLGGNLLDEQTGPIPGWIYNRPALVTLHLHGMGYSGPIPPQLFNFTSIQSVKLSGNKLTGSIPQEVSTRTTLNILWLSDNQLTGSIPTDIGNNLPMRDLRLSGNQLSGTVPASVGQMLNLQYLSLSGNSLSGALPATLAQLGELEYLALHDNEFTTIPALGQLGRLRQPGSVLSLQNNRLNFAALADLIFSHNQAPFHNFTYAPQKPIGVTEIVEAAPGATVTMTVSLAGTNNTYQWYKDGVAISGATDTSYTIASLAPSQAGQYTASVKNTSVPNLTLFRNPYVVSVYTAGFPRTVTLQSPAAGAGSLTNPVILQWNKDALATTYQVSVDTSHGFASPLLFKNESVTDTVLQLDPLSLLRPYLWRVRGVNSLGQGAWSEVRTFSMSPLVSVEDVVAAVPATFRLEQNYPNPFNPGTTIGFAVPVEAFVRIMIYDILGRHLVTLVEGEFAPGSYRKYWNAQGLPSGVYVYLMEAGAFRESRKLFLLK
ncbi:MAG: zinc-dependent metalloprotease family protein [Bacteroidota bacterium]